MKMGPRTNCQGGDGVPRHEAVKRTNCRLCGYLCGLLAYLENGRITAIEPDPERYPYDVAIVKGCQRNRRILEILDHPQRCNYPLKRVGERGSGQWQRVSWDQAMSEIAERLEKLKDLYGPETLATSIGGARAQYWPMHRFLNLFGSPNNVGIGQICWNPSIWAQTLTYGWPVDNELVPGKTACALVWGTNVAESDNSLLWRTLIRHTKTAGKLIVVDPRRTRTAERADIWLPLEPATDSALALGFLNVVLTEGLYDSDFVDRWCSGLDELRERVTQYPPDRVADITGLARDDIVRAARMFADKRPAAILTGRGIDQIGTNSMPAHRALAILRAITGNLDVRGASHLAEMPDFIPEVELELCDRLQPGQRAKQLGADRTQLQTYAGYKHVTLFTLRHGKRLPERYLTSAHPNLVWNAMLTGRPYPIRALIVMASNPLLSNADTNLVHEAFCHLDLMVALELFQTPTAMMADFVLPVAGSLEKRELQTNAGVSNFAYGGDQATPPLYERRSDYDFWRELGLAMGQADYWPWATLQQAYDAILRPAGLTWDAFCEGGLYSGPVKYRQHNAVDPASNMPLGFATPSGKVELSSRILADLGADPLPVHVPTDRNSPNTDYPLTLITGARKQPYYASEFRQLGEFRRVHPYPCAEMSSDTADAWRLREGDWVWVETKTGRARLRVKLARMRSNVVSIEYGWWFPERPAHEPYLGGVWESNANALTRADFAECDSLLGQWRYNGLHCRVVLADSIDQPSAIGDDNKKRR